jgi:hypothetical protein
MKTYIIVAKDYAYNDNYYTPYGFEYLVAMFYDYEKAQEKYWECEKASFIGEAIQKYFFGSLQEEETKYQKLADLFQRVWGMNMLDDEGYYQDFILPDDISLEHLKEVKNITGLAFHNLCIFDETPTYYRAIIQSENLGYEYFLAGYGGIYPENITTNHEDALNTAIAYIVRLLPDIQQNNTATSFRGTWSELSETPLLLEAYLVVPYELCLPNNILFLA